MSEGFQKFLADKQIRTEGTGSVKGLNTLAEHLGYKEDGFLYGSPFENFMADNPGAVQAIHDFMEKYYSENFEMFDEDGVVNEFEDEDDEDEDSEI